MESNVHVAEEVPIDRNRNVLAANKSPLRVLIVDDNTDTAELLAEAFQDFGHEVAVAFDGLRALEIAQTFKPNTVLLDIGLPEMDGYELAQRLRAASPDTPLRLIAVTGYGQQADTAKTRAARFDVHLVKPVDLETVVALLDAPPPAS